MWWINRFVSDKTRTVITNKFAKLGDKSGKSPLTRRCTYGPGVGATFNRLTAPMIDKSVLK